MIANGSKIKTSSNQNSKIIPYKIDIGIDGNIMPIHILKTNSWQQKNK